MRCVNNRRKLASHKPVLFDDLEHLPEWPLLVIANEFFDTMPMRQFIKSKDGWCERLVDWEKDHLVFALSPPHPAIFTLCAYTEWREGPEGMVMKCRRYRWRSWGM